MVIWGRIEKKMETTISGWLSNLWSLFGGPYLEARCPCKLLSNVVITQLCISRATVVMGLIISL